LKINSLASNMCFKLYNFLNKGNKFKNKKLFNYLFPMFCLYVGKFRFNYFHKGHKNMMVIKYILSCYILTIMVDFILFYNNYKFVNLALARFQFSTIFCKCMNNLCVVKFHGIKCLCDFFKRWPSSLHLLNYLSQVQNNTNKFNVTLWFNTFYVFILLRDKMPKKRGYC
jgi:hypothetical protein